MRNITRAAALAVAALGLTAVTGAVGAQSASAYQPAASTLYSTSGSSCNKHPCVLYPKTAQLPGGRIVAAFEDSEGSAAGQTLPIYKSDDDGDTWQKLTNLAPPSQLTNDAAYSAYTSNWTNPYFYVLPSALGSYAAGTLMLADVVSNADRSQNAIVLYTSPDQGATWSVVNTIATGPDSSDPVWEPYLMMYGGQLVAYYSDENDYLSYDSSTGQPTLDPNNTTAKDSGGQILDHRTWSGSGSWSAPVVDVPGDTVDMGGGKSEIGGNRPGMTTVVPTTDGKWLMTFEYDGGGSVHYKIASDPLHFFSVGGAAGSDESGLPVAKGSGGLPGGGSPVLARRADGSLVMNAAGSGDVWFNPSGSSTGTWYEDHSPVAAGYSRDLQPIADTKQLLIVSTAWAGDADGPITYATMDLGSSTGAYYAFVNRATGQVLAPAGGNIDDAAFTGNAPDIQTVARNDGSAAQWWHLARKGGSVTLLNKGGGRSVGIWQGNASSGSHLASWVDDDGTDKHWNLVRNSDGYVQLQSAANTSLVATGASDGTVDLESSSTSTNQQWQLVVDFGTTSTSQFKLVDRNSGDVLGINGGSTAAGASAVQWTDTGAADQQWNIVANGSGNEVLTDKNSGLPLGINGASTAAGASAVQYTSNGSKDQQWVLTQTGGWYTLKNVNSGLPLGIQGASTAKGANAVQYTANGGADQQWQLVQVGGF